jgi:hypothetical protein
VTLKNAKTLATLIGTIMSARTALQRVKQARVDSDRLELLDAVLNAAVVITGLLVIVRRLRQDEAA